jgi:hypothetical protein
VSEPTLSEAARVALSAMNCVGTLTGRNPALVEELTQLGLAELVDGRLVITDAGRRTLGLLNRQGGGSITAQEPDDL